uniref:NADH-ubiquinone oxidoreductase chain 2 n=1 Tax=Trigonopterus tanimbarensis TaxID=2678946 RepID=A0A7H1KHR4_9CUCU|nr:NADH dehydrogenase subunit 2 [Trigonopterus tanimbarensis]QNT26830.1 NADH dehydrogenase subunit 2 [Trigonopterus tanimbarensis]
MMNFYKILFFNLLVFSTLICISALSWMTAWLGLEMNLLSIIPLMKTYTNKNSAEAAIKYFIVQAMASAILMFSIMIFSSLNFFNLKFLYMPSMIMNATLLGKMGAAPFHIWFPEVISGLAWNIVIIILTWQKIAPFILLSYCISSSTFLSITIILSSLIGGLQGLNQVCTRKILAYSSINHMGWMISTLLSSLNLWSLYFAIYSLMNFSITMMFHKYSIFYMSQVPKMLSYNKKLKYMFMMNFLSLGGLPPFIGFLPKWITINALMNLKHNFMCFILVSFTLLTLYFYIRISFSSFSFYSLESFSESWKTKLNPMFFASNIAILTSIPMCFSMPWLF